jgi:signal transduction histidine kinase
MVTAYPSTESAVQCFRAGAFDYLLKPVRADELVHVIKRGLRHKEETLETSTLERVKETAEKANREKSLFLMQVSHDVRTIAESIIGYNDMLVRSNVDDKQIKHLNSIKANSHFLRSLADNMLDIAKIETERIRLKHQPFSLTEVIENVARIVYPSIEAKPVEFSYEINKDVPPALVGDSDRLAQILLNLLSNATKFTEKGEISIRARLMTIFGKGCHVFFVVKDTGPGIPKDRQMDVFKPFFQMEKQTHTHREKYGLGLWICKVLVEKMGGLISLHSEVGVGSEFRFSVRFDLPQE